MRKLKLYMETSVWNFYYADDAPEKKAITIDFFNVIKKNIYQIYISNIVLDEIQKASEEKEKLLITIINDYKPEILPINTNVLTLAEKYIIEMALPKRAVDDSKHAAIATYYEMDALISWNLKHLANLKRKQKINAINLKEGFTKALDIITPMEVSDE